MRVLIAVVASASILLASCSSGDKKAASNSTSTEPATATVATSSTTTATTLDASTTTELEPVSPTEYVPAALDPPVGEVPGDMLFFDDRVAYSYRDGEFTEVGEGPFYEVVDDGAGGILYQTADWPNTTIWWLPAGATQPRDLLVTSEDAYLELEGLTGTGAEREIVYQKGVNGDIETAIVTLRTYRMSDATVSELDVTGGWEYGTRISSIVDGSAAGLANSEGLAWFYWLDLASRTSLMSPDAPLYEPVSEDYPPGSLVTIDSGQLLIVGVGNGELLGLIRLTSSAGIDQVIATFPAVEGNWSPTGLVVVANHAVISRVGLTPRSEDGSRGPVLGPIVVDLATGEATTLPYAVNARSLADS